MGRDQYTRLTQDQLAQIKSHLSARPVSLSKSYSGPEILRELDVYVYDADPQSPVKTYDNQKISEGRFFRIVQFSNKVLAALYFHHDRYGIFGVPKTVQAFRLADLEMTEAQYRELLSDLSRVIHSLDPDVQIEWDGMEYSDTGPLVRTT